MKNMKRSYRRGKAYYAFMRRLKIWTCNITSTWNSEQFKKDVISGKKCNWLRTTGKPCSCEGCSPSYKRPQKQYWLKYEDCD